MNFQQLKYFKTVFECENTTRAAEILMISQPAVSLAVRELEAELAVQLFIRRNRGMIATEEGKLFYVQACRMLAQCDSAKRLVREAAERKQLVRVGMAPMAGHILFPLIYHKLRRDYPFVELELAEEGSYELIRQLDREEIDFAIIPEGITCSGCVKRKIYHTRMVFAVNKENPLAGQDKLDIHQLAEVPLAMHRKGFVQYENISRLLQTEGITPKIVAWTSNYMTIRSLIDCGAAGGFLMKEICEEDDQLRFFELPELKTFPIYIVWKEDGYLSQAARDLIRCCGSLQ